MEAVTVLTLDKCNV